jgi:gamma-butyrobetaine dioxygenase
MSHLQITRANELTIALDDGRCFPVHPLWLRERCQDARTFDLRTGQRLGDPSDLDLNLGLLSVSEPEPGRIRVRFSDGHESDFLAGDILAEAALAPGQHDIPAPRLWNGTLTSLPRATWSAQPTDADLSGWVSDFLEYGFVILQRVPPVPRTILQVAAAFGFTRETNFGAIFEVRSVPAASDLDCRATRVGSIVLLRASPRG